MLAIARDPEHQDLTCGYSGCAVRRRSACNGRPASHDLGTCQLCARLKGEVEAHPSFEGRRNPRDARQFR